LKFFVVLFLSLSFYSVSPVFAAPNCFSVPKQNINESSRSELELKLIKQHESFERTQAKNRAACLITTAQLNKIPVSRLLVDVRQANQTRAIPLTNINIVNIPLHMLGHKKYLKNKPLILMPIGAELRELLTQCGKLRQKGFKQTYVLKDGIHALQSVSKNKIMPANKVGLISPKRLFIERFERDWKLVYVGKGEVGRLSQYFNIIKTNKKPGKTISKIKKEKKKSNKPVGIIVVDQDGLNHTAIKKQFKKVKQPIVYYLEGGAESFNDFIHIQYLQTTKSEFVLQKPQACK